MDTFDPFSFDVNDLKRDCAADPSGDSWMPILPIPADAPKLPRNLVDSVARPHFSFSHMWRYVSASGERMMLVARYDKPANGAPPEKDIRPFTYGQDRNGLPGWRNKNIPSNRPLYRLDRLAGDAVAPVLVVEGEKAADAAAERFLDYVVTTSSGGSQASSKTDWSPLRGRDVVIWPDADEPGRKYADEVTRLLQDRGARSVSVVAVPDTFPSKWDLADPLPSGVVDGDLMSLLSRAAPQKPELGTWTNPDLTLLGTGRRAAPEFPLTLLGEFWGEWVTLRAKAASAPLDYVAVSLLACSGAAIANVRWPVAGANWSEPPLLWCGLVGSPSSGKSPAMDAAFSLMQRAEEMMAADYDEERSTHETARQVAKATREAWEADVKAAIKAGERPREMPAEAETVEMPPRPRIRIADATIEAMAKLSASLPRGLLLVRDELAGWLGAFDRYGGGGSDRAFAIEMYGGRPYIVDRVKSPDPVRIPRLSVGVLGGVQPDKLSDILDGPDDGLAARILWTWPDSVPDFKLSREDSADDLASAAFTRLTELAMGSDSFGAPQPRRIRLTVEAENYLEGYAQEIGRRANEASGILSGAFGKARGHVLRLATVLEHLWWSTRDRREPDVITTGAVLSAIGLVDGYFGPMAERVLGDATIPPKERIAMILARHLRRRRGSTFNAREMRREIGGVLRDAETMKAACTILVDAGLIREAFKRDGDSPGGRRSLTFEVNSAMLRD
jgi:hypothetical protein